MRKERRKRILSVTASVTTGTLIACMIWFGLTQLISGESIREAEIPYVILPQILLLGILCSAETEFIMSGEDRPLKKYWMRYLLHYAAVTATALVCGYFYGWYDLTLIGILLMCLTSLGIYVFSGYLKYCGGKKDADVMNACLKEIREKNETPR